MTPSTLSERGWRIAFSIAILLAMQPSRALFASNGPAPLPEFSQAEIQTFRASCEKHQGKFKPKEISCPGVACRTVPPSCEFNLRSTVLMKTLPENIDLQLLMKDFESVDLVRTRVVPLDQEVRIKAGETVRFKGTKLTLTAHSFKGRYPVLDYEFRTYPLPILRDAGNRCSRYERTSKGCQNYSQKVLAVGRDDEMTIKLEKRIDPCGDIPPAKMDHCVSVRDRCYDEQAFQYQDPEHCISIRRSIHRAKCLDTVASYRREREICKSMKPAEYPARGYCRGDSDQDPVQTLPVSRPPGPILAREKEWKRKYPDAEISISDEVCDCRPCYVTRLRWNISSSRDQSPGITAYYHKDGKLICSESRPGWRSGEVFRLPVEDVPCRDGFENFKDSSWIPVLELKE